MIMETGLTENLQPIEKPDYKSYGLLSVHSIWDTLQGEGPFAGTPATFIRMAGCNLNCRWCDTDYTSNRKKMTKEEILREMYVLPKRDLVVFTGGEPFRQDISLLVELLIQDRRKHVQIETNGTLILPSRLMDVFSFYMQQTTIVCSPKTPKIHDEMWKRIDALKYVVEAGQIDKDGFPLSSVGPQYGPPAKPPKDWKGEIYIQPLDTQDEQKNKENLDAAVKSCMQHGHRLTLQLHKLCGLD